MTLQIDINLIISVCKKTYRVLIKETGTMEYLTERITLDPDVCNGKPTIRGKRITVETVLEYLSAGDRVEDILHQYPMLEEEDISACLAFAGKVMKQNYTIKPVA